MLWTLGTMAVDHEMRIDYAKLRKDRLGKNKDSDGEGRLRLNISI